MAYTPRFTVLPMARYEACFSAYARELEVAWFCDDHGIEGPDAVAQYEDRGVRLYSVLAGIPFRSEHSELGSRADVGALIESKVEQSGLALRAGERAFIETVLHRRDLLVERMIAACARAGYAVSSLEVVTGSQVLHVEMPIGGDGEYEWISAKPGWLAVAKDAQGKAVSALIVDFREFHRESGIEKDNPSLRATAVMAAVNWPSVESVSVAQVSRGDLGPGEATSHSYRIEDLGGVHFDTLVRVMRESLAMAEPFFATGTTNPSEEHAQRLNDAAKPGNHCEFCRGKCNCEKLHQSLASASKQVASVVGSAEVVDTRKALEPALKLVDGDANVRLTEENLTVTIRDLMRTSEAIGVVTEPLKMAEAVRKDTDTIVRNLIAAGHSVAGHSLKPGQPTLAVREVAGENMSPGAVYQALRKAGLLPNVKEEDFVRLTSQVAPTALRGFMADLHKVPESEVFSKLLKPLGDGNPLIAGAKTSSVVRAKIQATAEDKAATPQPQVASAPAQPVKPAQVARKR